MPLREIWFLTMWRSVFALAVTATVIWEVSSTDSECSLDVWPEDDSSYSDSDSGSWEDDYYRQPPIPPNNCGNVKQVQLDLAQACNSIAIKGLFEQDVAAPGVSKILSPISYYLLLAQLALYSKGQTYTELMTALDVTTKYNIRTAFPEIIKSIREQQGGGMNIASKVFVNDAYQLSASFKNDSVAVFNETAENVNFSNPCQAANIINKWVSDSTKGNITDLFTEDTLSSTTRLVLANAISFKGVWQQEFNSNLTQFSDFYVNCQKTVTVKMMQQIGKFNYAYSPDLDAQLVEIPFQNHSMSFVLALPTQRDGLRNVLDKLRSPPMTNKVLGGMCQETVTLLLPKFDVSSKFDLKDVLKPAGVETIFGPEAELSGIVVPDEALYVSDAVQTTTITVNEIGAEADSSTVAVVATRSLPSSPKPEIIVRADHPFLFGIKINRLGLFILGGTIYG